MFIINVVIPIRSDYSFRAKEDHLGNLFFFFFPLLYLYLQSSSIHNAKPFILKYKYYKYNLYNDLAVLLILTFDASLVFGKRNYCQRPFSTMRFESQIK